jgi:hypothetical protein
MYRSLKLIEGADLDSPGGKPLVFGLTMSVTEDLLGIGTSYDLVPGGSNEDVEEHNKASYVDGLIAHKYFDNVQSQTLAFRKGFQEIIPLRVSRDFLDADDINQLLRGEPHIDVEDLIANLQISTAFPRNDPQVKWFLELLRDPSVFTQARLRQLVQFITGDDGVPLGGFKNLNEPMKLSRDPLGKPDKRLPSASTCFNRLDLPEYTNKGVLQEKLLKAIGSNSGFELS